METTTLRSEGNTLVVAIPNRLLAEMHLKAGSQVSIGIREGKIIMEPKTRPKYTLAELMAQCDLSQPMTEEEREWLDAPPVGNEEI